MGDPAIVFDLVSRALTVRSGSEGEQTFPLPPDVLQFETNIERVTLLTTRNEVMVRTSTSVRQVRTS